MRLFVLLNLFLVVLTSRLGAQDNFIYEDHGKRDPFLQLINMAGAVSNYETDFVIADLVLEGIVQGSGTQNFAIINGKIVKPQDVIGQFTVMKVEPKSVTLTKNNQTFELYLKKEE